MVHVCLTVPTSGNVDWLGTHGLFLGQRAGRHRATLTRVELKGVMAVQSLNP